MRAYQTACAEIVRRYRGHIAQYLGDGLLIYFGYPTAHEDDAQRAVRAGLELVVDIPSRKGQAAALAVRVGIHTGLVVVGEVGAVGSPERLALGDAPNVAARVQGLAEPNTVVISAATRKLIEGRFELASLGEQALGGVERCKLEAALLRFGLPLEESVPLLASLLSRPAPARYPLPAMGPQRQRRRTLETLAALLLGWLPSDRCCWPWRICTGPTPPRWS